MMDVKMTLPTSHIKTFQKMLVIAIAKRPRDIMEFVKGCDESETPWIGICGVNGPSMIFERLLPWEESTTIIGFALTRDRHYDYANLLDDIAKLFDVLLED